MNMYFWSCNDPSVPPPFFPEVRNGAISVTSSPSWRKPETAPSTLCDLSMYFTPHNIIMNLTFCMRLVACLFLVSDCLTYCAQGCWGWPKLKVKFMWLWAM